MSDPRHTTKNARHVRAGRLGALTKWGNEPDRSRATAPARQAAEERFLNEVRAEHPDLDEPTARKMAEARRRVYYARISRLGVAARRRKKGT